MCVLEQEAPEMCRRGQVVLQDRWFSRTGVGNLRSKLTRTSPKPTLFKCKCCLVVELRVVCFSQHHTRFLCLRLIKQHFRVICATWWVNIWVWILGFIKGGGGERGEMLCSLKCVVKGVKVKEKQGDGRSGERGGDV